MLMLIEGSVLGTSPGIFIQKQHCHLNKTLHHQHSHWLAEVNGTKVQVGSLHRWCYYIKSMQTIVQKEEYKVLVSSEPFSPTKQLNSSKEGLLSSTGLHSPRVLMNCGALRNINSNQHKTPWLHHTNHNRQVTRKPGQKVKMRYSWQSMLQRRSFQHSKDKAKANNMQWLTYGHKGTFRTSSGTIFRTLLLTLRLYLSLPRAITPITS